MHFADGVFIGPYDLSLSLGFPAPAPDLHPHSRAPGCLSRWGCGAGTLVTRLISCAKVQTQLKVICPEPMNARSARDKEPTRSTRTVQCPRYRAHNSGSWSDDADAMGRWSGEAVVERCVLGVAR